MDDNKAKSTGRNEGGLALVIESPLFSTSDARDRHPTIEERHSLGVLLFLKLDDEIERSLVSVDWQTNGPAGYLRQIAKKPRETRLALAWRTQDFVAQIEHVMLVTLGPLRHIVTISPCSDGRWKSLLEPDFRGEPATGQSFVVADEAEFLSCAMIRPLHQVGSDHSMRDAPAEPLRREVEPTIIRHSPSRIRLFIC